MSPFAQLYNYLQDKPQVGIVSGIGTGIVGQKAETLLTDEHILKLVSGLSLWVGCLIACLTLIAWLIKVYDLIIVRIKIKRK